MIIRIAFGVLFVLATALLYLPLVQQFFARRDAVRWLGGLFVASRAFGWLASYVAVPGLVRSSDLVLYYHPEAQRALSGEIPYRDFPTSYGPLFPYLAGLFLPVWNSPAAVAIVMIAVEIAAVLAFVALVRRHGGVSETTIARTLFIYAVSPAALYWSGMIAYNSSLVLLFWVLAIGALAADRYTTSVVAAAGSVLLGKLLGVLAAPLWLVHPRRRLSLVAGAGVVAVAAIVAARPLGFDLTIPLQREGGRTTSGNLWFLASGVISFGPDDLVWKVGPLLSFALATVAFMVWLSRSWRQAPTVAQMCGAAAAIGWLFMMLSKKAYPHYTPMFLLLAVFAVAASWQRARLPFVLLAAFGAVGIIEPGLWNALRQPQFLGEACRGGGCGPTVYALVAVDVFLMALTAYFFALCAGAAGTTVPVAAEPAQTT